VDVNELPLLELFTRLRDAGLPLGIDEYQLVLRSLQAGFGMSDRAALKRLCQTVWVKSPEGGRLFEYHFQQVMGSEVVLPTLENLALPSGVHRISPGIYLMGVILGVGIILGVISTFKQQSQGDISNTQTVKSSPEKTLLNTPTVKSSSQKTLLNTPNIILPTPSVIATQTAKLIPNPIKTPQSNTNKTQSNLIFWTLPLLVMALSGGYVIVKRVATRKAQQNQDKEKPGFLEESQDEVQVAQAVLQATSIKDDIPESRFILIGEYFPVTVRQMKQIWRYFRRPVREGSKTELDVKATVHQIGRQGLLLKPVLMPRRVNKAELLLLMDQDGSMVPFGALSRRLAETALRGGLLGKAGIYYFHNCPVEYLYHDPNLLEAELIGDVVSNVCTDRTAVLIFSDAGAARGGYSQERYELTKKFLAQLQQQMRYVAWLNPMPRSRWAGSTATDITRLVPMFEFSRRGLQDAIGVLRGRPTNFEGRRL
jgi:uncharacterized protein with von Willebrand factor type A (vWA) domain